MGERGTGGPKSGTSSPNASLAHRRERALGPVEEAGEVEGHRRPAGELVPGPHGVRHGVAGERHERHDVDHPEPRVGAGVVAQVEPGHRLDGHRPRRVLADEGQHRPVVVGVAVDVEQIGARDRGDRGDQRLVATLADVDDALQHCVAGHRDLPPEASLPGPTCTLGAVVRPVWQKSGTRSGRPSLR